MGIHRVHTGRVLETASPTPPWTPPLPHPAQALEPVANTLLLCKSASWIRLSAAITMSNTAKHPNFGKIFTMGMFTLFLVDALLFGLCFYFHGKGQEQTADLLLISVFVVTFLGFTAGFTWLYNIKCPGCGHETKTIKNKQIDMWQAYCPRCDVTWDLGAGADTGP